MRQGALRSALSARVREGNVVLVDGWKLENPKTKDLISSLGSLGLAGKTLIVDSLDNRNLLLSARNIRRAKVVNSFGLNIYDLLYHEKLVLSRSAASELEELLGPKQAQTETPEATPEAAAPEEKPKRARKPKKEAA